MSFTGCPFSPVSNSPTVPSNTNSDEEGSFVEENLGLIIGVPTGIGLSLLGFIACFIYCGERYACVIDVFCLCSCPVWWLCSL